MKIGLSQTTEQEFSSYREGVAQLEDARTTKTQLEAKRSALQEEITQIDHTLSDLEQIRPTLLEAVLRGDQPESALSEQQTAMERLKNDKQAKADLLLLVEQQVGEKITAADRIKHRLNGLLRQAFSAIEGDMIKSMPKDLIPYLRRLEIVSNINHRTAWGTVQTHLPQSHAESQQETFEIMREFSLPRVD